MTRTEPKHNLLLGVRGVSCLTEGRRPTETLGKCSFNTQSTMGRGLRGRSVKGWALPTQAHIFRRRPRLQALAAEVPSGK